MTKVQIAISDPNYAAEIGQLLEDGEHLVYLVDRPSVGLDGIILLDGPHLDALAPDPRDAERYILLERDAALNTADLWRAGIRHLAFKTDPISVTRLAVLAAELRFMTSRSACSGAYNAKGATTSASSDR
jgi:hypothetical protein